MTTAVRYAELVRLRLHGDGTCHSIGGLSEGERRLSHRFCAVGRRTRAVPFRSAGSIRSRTLETRPLSAGTFASTGDRSLSGCFTPARRLRRNYLNHRLLSDGPVARTRTEQPQRPDSDHEPADLGIGGGSRIVP